MQMIQNPINFWKVAAVLGPIHKDMWCACVRVCVCTRVDASDCEENQALLLKPWLSKFELLFFASADANR